MGDKNYINFEKTLEFESDIQSVEETDIVAYVDKRWQDMDLSRAKKEARRQQDERQLQSFVEDSMDGKAVVNMPIEQNQIEMYQGQINPILNYSVDPEGKADINQLILAKVVLDHFVKKEHINKEIRRRDYNSAKYGSGILGVTIDQENKIQWETDSDDFYSDKWKEKKLTLRHIGIKDIPVRRVWFDERPTQYTDCMDCIYEEDMSIEEFRLKYLDEKGEPVRPFKHILAVQTSSNEINPYGRDNDKLNTNRNVKIRHYYNKVTGVYYIIADKMWLIYKGKMTSKHGELPFILRQFSPDTSNIYGISLVQKMESVKPYINNFLKVALDGMWYSVAPILLTGNGSNIDGEMYYDPSNVNVWNFTGDVQAQSVRELQFQANINGIMEIIRVMEDYGTQNTGINIKAQSRIKTAFEAGLQKEEQNARLNNLYQIRDEAIECALTMLLCNIMQYAPTTLGEFLLSDGGDKEFKPYQIKVNDKKVVKRGDGEMTLEDDIGNVDFFDLSSDLLQEAGGLKVRIDTPTSQTVLKSLEKAEYTDMVNNALTLRQVFPDLNIGNGEDWMKRLESLYGFDVNKLTLKSKTDLRKDKIDEMMQVAKSMTAEQPEAQPGQPMGDTQPIGQPTSPEMDKMATQQPEKPGSFSQLKSLADVNPNQAMETMGTK